MVRSPVLGLAGGGDGSDHDPDGERRRRHAAAQLNIDSIREYRRGQQRAWRASHPAERALQQARYRQRRYYREHPERVLPAAMEIVGIRRSTLVYLYDPLHDDLTQVAAVALMEGRDARQAVKEYRSQEVSWGRKTIGLIDDIAA